MSFIGKLHEISFYGLITTIICLITHKITFAELLVASPFVSSNPGFFLGVLFWTSVLYVPIAIIGAYATKYLDDGEGLLFDSDNIIVIIFAHIAEELLGLVLTPFWFLTYLFTRDLDGDKLIDTITFVIEIIFFIVVYCKV